MDVNEMMMQLDFVVVETQRSQEALLAANIVDHLPPTAQELAIDYLWMLEKHFVMKQAPVTE